MIWRALTVATVLVISVALLSSGAAASRDSSVASASAAGSYIVVFRDNVDTDAKADSLEQQGNFQSSHRYHYALKGFAAYLSAGALPRRPFPRPRRYRRQRRSRRRHPPRHRATGIAPERPLTT